VGLQKDGGARRIPVNGALPSGITNPGKPTFLSRLKILNRLFGVMNLEGPDSPGQESDVAPFLIDLFTCNPASLSNQHV